MVILLDYENGIPLYEQVKAQIKEQILCGKLNSGEALPSIRVLAKELKIGIITAKRAYDELIQGGYAYSVPGKGVFVGNLPKDERVRIHEDEVANSLKLAVCTAKKYDISKQKIMQMLDDIYKED
jgi:GntR family transcriptional regulator